MKKGTKGTKAAKGTKEDALAKEYDFRGGVRGKHARRFAEGSNVVVLEPDVAKVFPDSSAVNEALRALVRIAERTRKREGKKRVAQG
jgi:hypothetical protein